MKFVAPVTPSSVDAILHLKYVQIAIEPIRNVLELVFLLLVAISGAGRPELSDMLWSMMSNSTSRSYSGSVNVAARYFPRAWLSLPSSCAALLRRMSESLAHSIKIWSIWWYYPIICKARHPCQMHINPSPSMLHR